MCAFIDGILNFQHNDISKSCHDRQWIDENETFVITFTHWNLDQETELLSNQFSSSCQLFIAKPELRLSATILYQPADQDCRHGYLRIGNDKYRPDIVSMTSFQFCENLDNIEIVSRSNTLWIVNKRRFGYQIEGHIKIQSRPPVLCNTSQFECSPLQCVPLTSLCDDVVDCDNGRDEYCDQHNSGACFLCDDGTCISPTLPRYHYNWGKQYWYICDGFSHCKDGSDEKEDKCQQSCATSSLHSCMSKTLGKSILTWDRNQCSEKTECLQSEECEQNSVLQNVPVSSIAISVCALFIVLTCALCFYLKSGRRKRRRQKSSDGVPPRCRMYRGDPPEDITTNLHSPENGQQA